MFKYAFVLIWLLAVGGAIYVIHKRPTVAREDRQVGVDSHLDATNHSDPIDTFYLDGPVRVYLDGVLVDTYGLTTASTLPALIPHTAESRKYSLGDELKLPHNNCNICGGIPFKPQYMAIHPFVPFDLRDNRHVEELLLPCDSESNGRYVRMVEEWLASGIDSNVYFFEHDSADYRYNGGIEIKLPLK